MPADNDLNQLIEKFLTHLSTVEKRSRLTVANYRLYLNQFLAWGGKTKPRLNNINHLSVEHLADYNQYLKAKKISGNNPLATATQNYYLIALRSFLKYLNADKLKVPDYRLIKLNAAAPRVAGLRADEAEDILQACRHSRENELIKQRDLAILELLLSTGLKVSELSHLTRTDVNSNQKTVTVVSSKNQTRTLTLDQSSLQAITSYLRKRHDTDAGLFISHDRAQSSDRRREKSGHALSVRSLQRIVAHYCRLAGLKKKVTPSALRNWFAQGLIKRGNNIEQIQTALGHTNILTTRRYAKTKA